MLTYRIHRGGYDDFAIDGGTGIISVARKLDYDKRESYDIEIVATDGGIVVQSIDLSGCLILVKVGSIYRVCRHEGFFFYFVYCTELV